MTYEGREERGWQAMARTFARAADHSHTLCTGGRPLLGHLQGWQVTTSPPVEATASKRQLCHPRRARKGRSPTASPQGAVACSQPCR
ncbi:hypothetical protein GW17_00045680 [Ensete ventricosum]|nr:hypothetical protein GW17_00045680 [Ensete ventricosum]